MSSVHQTNGAKYFNATLSTTAPTPDDNILVVAWAKRPPGLNVGSAEYIVEAKAATESSWVRCKAGGGPKFGAHCAWDGPSQSPTQAANYSEDTWYLVGAYLEASTGGFIDLFSYQGTTKASSTFNDGNSATENLTLLKIGQGANTNSYTRWPGKTAEVAIFTVASADDADALIADLLTTKADAVTLPSGAALLNYWPLLDSATATVGPDLTNNGGTTFDDTDHPSLSGGVGTTNGVGSAAGTSTVSGVGSSAAVSTGTAAGTGAASGVGASAAGSVGSAAGTSTASGVGQSTAASVGTAAGTSTVSGVGSSTAAGSAVGTAAGTSAVSGVGASIAAAVGIAAGTSTVSGVADAPAEESTGGGGWIDPKVIKRLENLARDASKARQKAWEKRQDRETRRLAELASIYDRVNGIATEEEAAELASAVAPFVSADQPSAPAVDWAALLATAEAVADVAGALQRILNERHQRSALLRDQADLQDLMIFAMAA